MAVDLLSPIVYALSSRDGLLLSLFAIPLRTWQPAAISYRPTVRWHRGGAGKTQAVDAAWLLQSSKFSHQISKTV